MRYGHILAEYLRIVQEINDSATAQHWNRGNDQLLGLKRCLEAMGWDSGDIGQLIMDADAHYLAQGIDRPMCGGVFLDWEPMKEMAVTR